MGLMVERIPREWWLSKAFSNGLAKFSRPLGTQRVLAPSRAVRSRPTWRSRLAAAVWATDLFVGETHAMRIDVTIIGPEPSASGAHRPLA